MGRNFLPGGFSRCIQIQCLVNPVSVVVILKLHQLLFQIALVPEKSLVQKLSSNGANEPFGEGMRYRCMGNGFDFLDLSNSQVGPPLEVAE